MNSPNPQRVQIRSPCHTTYFQRMQMGKRTPTHIPADRLLARDNKQAVATPYAAPSIQPSESSIVAEMHTVIVNCPEHSIHSPSVANPSVSGILTSDRRLGAQCLSLRSNPYRQFRHGNYGMVVGRPGGRDSGIASREIRSRENFSPFNQRI